MAFRYILAIGFMFLQMNQAKANEPTDLLSRFFGTGNPAANIYFEWVALPTLVTLDTAYCNKKARLRHEEKLRNFVRINLEFNLNFNWSEFTDKPINRLELMRNIIKFSQKCKKHETLKIYIDNYYSTDRPYTSDTYDLMVTTTYQEIFKSLAFKHLREKLTKLSLSINNVDFSFLNANNLPNLTDLSLIVSEGTLGDGIKTLSNLTKLTLYAQDNVDFSFLNADNLPKLTDLSLTFCRGTLGDGIKTLSNLTKFTLHGTKNNSNITPAVLTDILSNLPNLQYADFFNTCFDNTNFADMMKKHIQTLWIAGNNITRSAFTVEAFKQYSQLPGLTSLTDLHVSRQDLDDDSFRNIVKYFLNLKHFKITCAGIIDPAKDGALANNTLTSLKIAGCNGLNDNAIQGILNNCAHLEDLDITNTPITNDAFTVFLTENSSNGTFEWCGPQLKRLIMMQCTQLTDGIWDIIYKIKTLEHVELSTSTFQLTEGSRLELTGNDWEITERIIEENSFDPQQYRYLLTKKGHPWPITELSG